MSENKNSDCGALFKKALRTLTDSMEGLRDFVTVVESYLKERQMKIVAKHASGLVPFF